MKRMYALVLVVLGIDLVRGMTMGEVLQSKRDLDESAIDGGLENGAVVHRDYSVYFEMTVENHLNATLQNPKAITWYGYISHSPKTLRPCSKDVIAGHKNGGTSTGTSGIVSWKIKERGLTIIVFYNVGYHSCNALGLGIYKDLPESEPSYDNRKDYFNDLYHYGDDIQPIATNAKKTVINNYDCYGTQEICTENKGLQVCGHYSTNAGAKFEVKIKHKKNPEHCFKK